MLKLIQNEYIKILKKKSTIAWIVILILTALGYQYLMNSALETSYDYYYPGGYEYMSEQYIDATINDLKNYKSSDETEDPYLSYYEQIKEAKLFEQEEWVYNELNSSFTELYVKDNSQVSKEAEGTFAKILSFFVAKDYKGYFELKASQEKPTSYTFKGSEDAITSPYKYKLEHGCTPYESKWKSDLVDSIISYQEQLEAMATSTTGDSQATTKYEQLMEGYLIAQHKLVNNIQYSVTEKIPNDYSNTNDSSKFWTAFESSTSTILMLSVLIIIIAGGCIASEFSSGTIKFLLINPVKRSKIILSKYLMVLSFTAILMAGFYVINVIFCMIFHGTSDLSAPFLSVTNGVVHSSSAFLYIAKLYVYATVEVITYGTMAFAISSLFRNSSVAIGASVAFLVSGSVITIMLQQFHQDWGRYLLFANTDLLAIKNGASLYPHHTFSFAVVTLMIYIGVMWLIAYDGFCRREV